MLTANDLLATLRRVVDESGPEITMFRFRNETGISFVGWAVPTSMEFPAFNP